MFLKKKYPQPTCFFKKKYQESITNLHVKKKNIRAIWYKKHYGQPLTGIYHFIATVYEKKNVHSQPQVFIYQSQGIKVSILFFQESTAL